MREYATPAAAQASAATTLDDLDRNAREAPDVVAFSHREGDAWRDVSAAEFHAQVRAVAKGLLDAGLDPGDRVVLMGRTRYEWVVADYGVWYAGGVTVPIYETSSSEQVEWILSDSGARFAVVEHDEHRERVAAASGAAGSVVERWWTMEPAAGSHPGADLVALAEAGRDVEDAELDRRRAAVGEGELATIIYTSGTTGHPKGCMLTHGNFAAELDGTAADLAALFDPPDASTLLFLPLAHVFARIIEVGAVRHRVRLGFCPDVRRLVQDLESFQPSFLLAVPRMFEKIFNSASQRAAVDGHGRAFDRATEVAIAYSQAQDDGRPGPVLRAQHRVFDRLVYAGVRRALGGRCRWVVSGGAPLGDRLAHFFRGIGVEVLEGYGLTETTGATTLNVPGATRIGSVGRPMAGTRIRVDDEGELLVSGPHVFRGYWGDPDEDPDTDAPGWLRTGDLGEIDDQGFVRVTGRLKEMMVTAGGKNVAPAVLEDRVRADPLIAQCLVVGDGLPYVAALVTLDPDAFRAWRTRRGREGEIRDLAHDPELRAEVQRAVDAANAAVSQAESIRRFTVLPVEWSEESGELTPSLKLRRNRVLLEYRRDIAALYE